MALLLVFSLLTPQSVMAQDMQPDAKTAEITETESALEKDGDETKEPSAEESPQEPVASPSEEPTEEVQEPQLPEEMPPSEEEETPDTAPAAESETDGSSQENFILEQETAATGEAALKKGWIQEEGKIRYYNEDGSYTRNNFQKIGSRSYYFDKDGYLVTGWLVKGNDTYYLKQTGEFGVKGCLLKGWQNIGKYRYHFDSSGVMTLGWITSGGKTYYMKKTGEDGIRGHMLKGLAEHRKIPLLSGNRRTDASGLDHQRRQDVFSEAYRGGRHPRPYAKKLAEYRRQDILFWQYGRHVHRLAKNRKILFLFQSDG